MFYQGHYAASWAFIYESICRGLSGPSREYTGLMGMIREH